MSHRAFKVALTSAALVALLATAFAGAEIVQKGALRLKVDSGISPKKLPRDGRAPIAVSVGWDITTTDSSEPPKLKALQIEINRNGHLESSGLPVCPVNRIQPASSERALSNCRSALVGEGRFSAQVALGNQEPYAASGRLLVFNGEKGGKPVLLGQIYSAHPFATSFVIPFVVSERGHGTFGTTLSAKVPKALLSWGNLTGIEMKLSRRYGFEGTRHSYVSAACPAPKGFSRASFSLARASFEFVGGSKLASTISDDCRVRG